jgi:acetyl-CoA acetyltransferase
MTTAERAKHLKRKPAYILGAGETTTHQSISNMPDFTVSGAVESGRQAYAAAGLSATDVDVAILYDAFTICTLMFLEDLGFCKKGEGGAFVENGGIAPGGRFPVNTNGGGLSYCHPGMYGLLVLIEAARQIHGVCDKRQVKNANVAIAHGNGGVFSSQCTVLLGSENTL